jgi:hypothetical protein
MILGRQPNLGSEATRIPVGGGFAGLSATAA